MTGNPNVADKRARTGGLSDLLKVKQLGSSRTRMRAGAAHRLAGPFLLNLYHGYIVQYIDHS